jgi:hypothetical protein
MKFSEFFALAHAGAPIAVECKPGVSRWEGCYPEAGMRLDVVGGILDDVDVARMDVDFSRFDEFNRRFESANFYHSKGPDTVTAREANCYRVRDFIYVDPEEDIEAYFTVLGDARKALLDSYAALPEPRPSYVSWLEDLVLALPAFAAQT